MSFDLYFYKHKDSILSEKDVAAYLTDNLISEYDNQWVYENPDTGTYFIIEREEKAAEESVTDELESFEDFISLNFFFYINFSGPHFLVLKHFR